MGNTYCPTAQRGVKCTDSSCHKKHDVTVVRCEPCDCSLPVSSLKQHQNGKQHLQNVSSKGSPKPSTFQHSPPLSISSSHRSAPPPGAMPLSGGVVVSRPNGRSLPPAYCATTLLGDTCVDSRCPHSHDILRCEPCGRSYPASVFNQHLSGSSHLEKVASNTPTDPRQSYPSLATRTNPQPAPPQTTFPPSRGKPPITNPRTPQPPPSQLISANPQPTSSQAASPTSSGRPLTDPRVTVTHEDGLDLVVEGIGAATGHAFPSANRIIVIEKTNVESSLTVKSMALVPSPNPCFVARLPGNAIVRKSTPREIHVSFKAPRAGTFHAILKITFTDKIRPKEQEFTVIRRLRGRAILPSDSISDGDTPSTVEHIKGSEGTGIIVSHDFGLEFSVEYSQFDEHLPTQTKEVIVTDSSTTPSVSFKTIRVHLSDGSLTGSFSAQLEGDSERIEPQERRVVAVSFKPQREGLCEAILELTFQDLKRNAVIVIMRTLSGWARKRTAWQLHCQDESARNPVPVNGWTDDHVRVTPDEDEDYLDCDGTGVSVSHEAGLEFGIVERKRPNGPFVMPSSLLTVKHAEGFPAVTLIKEIITTSDRSDSDFVAVFEGDSRYIQPGTESTVRVIFGPKFEGLFEATLELVFYDVQRSASFIIRRRLQGIAGSLQDYQHFESLGQEDNDEPTGGSLEAPQWKVVSLVSPDWRRRPGKFPEYEVPPTVQDVVDKSTFAHPYDKNAPDLISALELDSLGASTYAHHFKALLNIEDGHRQWDVQCQPPSQVNVQNRGQQYSVEIEENDEDLLPEVVLGDFLWLEDVQDYIRYEARITNIDVFTRRHLAVLKILLRLPAGFNLYRGAQFILRLRHNRITLRRQYHALAASFAAPRWLLFPSASDIKPIKRLARAGINDLKFRQLANRNIRDDEHQLQAVISTLEQPQGSVPFIIYGPPGTGKTSIVVEGIMQLVLRDAGVRILACAPSDAAADLLFERLTAAGLDSDKLYRLDSSHHEETAEDSQTCPLIPGHERLLAFRIVLSTCSSSSSLQTLNVPVGHFSHIVIDEAGQADEPLAMIPIMAFSDAHTNVILAGDPNQLGPVIKSPTAAGAGLGRSYLERLMLIREVYGLDKQAAKTIVSLQRNHRSHGAIIAWPNRYFYEDTLREYGHSYIMHHLVLSNVLPKKGFPVVFHGVKGCEQHTRWSPSYFNILEASIVRDYCVKLIGDPERKIYPEEIGVIAPHKSQVRAIRELLKVAKLSDISVGPVEEFQGQERKVIILATTRSDEETHPRRSLAFLEDHQRVNVAITRAQALLIVIGNPEVLGKDGLWRTFLNYIKSRKGWTGKPPSWDPEAVVHVPGYQSVPRKGDAVYGEEFIGGKSENIYRSSSSSGRRTNGNDG